MEHPLITGLDKLTEEELTQKIYELNNKLMIAARSGNGVLANQVRMALESYQNRYQSLVRERNEQANTSAHLDKIQIK
jgi:hypothetical protein